MSSPPSKPMASAMQATATFTPNVQLGPDFNGVITGYYYGSTATFYVELGQGPNQTYAWYSPTQGSSWIPIPNNQQTTGSGQYPLSWYLSVPSGSNVKFLMGAG
jgi:hypothetical protein